MRINTGCRSVLIAGGVGTGKVLLWHVVEKKWSGAEAVAMHEGPLATALSAAYPTRSSYRVLEDNDPSGYQRRVARAAKEGQNIV